MRKFRGRTSQAKVTAMLKLGGMNVSSIFKEEQGGKSGWDEVKVGVGIDRKSENHVMSCR